jgi:prepilin-type processing-associated H-X9-DG protein
MKKTVIALLAVAIIVAAGAAVLRHLVLARERPLGGSPSHRCGNNLKQIGLAIRMHESDKGRRPSSFRELGRYVSFQSKVFICPAAEAKPGEFVDVDVWTSYVYFPDSTTSTPAAVAAYCDPTNHGGQGAVVLFVDGHTEWFLRDDFRQLSEQQGLEREPQQ